MSESLQLIFEKKKMYQNCCLEPFCSILTSCIIHYPEFSIPASTDLTQSRCFLFVCVRMCVLASAAAAGKTSAHALSLDKVLSSSSASLQCPTLNTVYIDSSYRTYLVPCHGHAGFYTKWNDFQLEMYY